MHFDMPDAETFAIADSMTKRCTRRQIILKSLHLKSLHCNGFGEVTGLVYVAAAADGDVVGE
jgi:hypothetical protein